MPPGNQPLSRAGDGGWPHHALLTRLGHPCSPAPTTGAGFPCSPQSAGGEWAHGHRRARLRVDATLHRRKGLSTALHRIFLPHEPTSKVSQSREKENAK